MVGTARGHGDGAAMGVPSAGRGVWDMGSGWWEGGKRVGQPLPGLRPCAPLSPLNPAGPASGTSLTNRFCSVCLV